MKLPATEPLVRLSAALALVGLVLMVWSILDPRPAPVILFMSLGQFFGTISLTMFLLAVGRDIRAGRLH